MAAIPGLKAEISSLLLGQPQIVDSVDIYAARSAHLHKGYPVRVNIIINSFVFHFSRVSSCYCSAKSQRFSKKTKTESNYDIINTTLSNNFSLFLWVLLIYLLTSLLESVLDARVVRL